MSAHGRTQKSLRLTSLELCRFYFAYCEAAFDAKYIHNFQILWEKSAEPPTAPLHLAHSTSEELSKPLGALITPMQAAPSDPITQVCFRVSCSGFLGQSAGAEGSHVAIDPVRVYSAQLACLRAPAVHKHSF